MKDEEELFHSGDQPCSRSTSAPECVLRLEVKRLNSVRVLVQEHIDGVAVSHLGWGSSAAANLALRKRLGQPGAPFGGLGFLDPQQNIVDATENVPPKCVTRDFARDAKLREFRRCANGEPSMYFWALQPVYDWQESCVACEVLLRCHNGADSAPYEDLLALMNPLASEDVRRIHATWKATEVVDWILAAVKGHPLLRKLTGLAVNIRPLDLRPSTAVFQEVSRRLAALSPNDRRLLLRSCIIEVTEDQDYPEEMPMLLTAWQDLGFRLACDDVIGELACQALEKQGQNFHTTDRLWPFLHHFTWLKVDMEWAGYCLFLSHPSYNSRADVKSEVLSKAKDEDLVYVPAGPRLRCTGASHSSLLKEFADWVLEILKLKKDICIELSISTEDENNKYALDKLKEHYHVDIFGEHRASFRFQGGPTGPKAFQLESLMQGAQVIMTGASSPPGSDGFCDIPV